MLTLASPAKINLFLRVLSRRADGYHDLASLFQAIDLCDTLHFSLADSDLLTCTDPLLPTDSTNLVLKAAHLFRRKTGKTFGLCAHIVKKIPSQAGLGGGSGNAATTLWALNQLCGEPASLQELIEWSGEIGSDISFFLSQGTAYCTGRGEHVRDLASLAPLGKKLWVVKPQIGLSTPEVFRRLVLAELEPRDPEASLQFFLRGVPHYFNDLELAAFSALPELKILKQRLVECGFETVLLSGSGTSFFCIGNGTPPEDPTMSVFQVKFLNRVPGFWYGAK